MPFPNIEELDNAPKKEADPEYMEWLRGLNDHAKRRWTIFCIAGLAQTEISEVNPPTREEETMREEPSVTSRPTKIAKKDKKKRRRRPRMKRVSHGTHKILFLKPFLLFLFFVFCVHKSFHLLIFAI